MLPDQPNQQAIDESTGAKEGTPSGKQPLYFLPFPVQLQNIFPIEIIARRFPVDTTSSPLAQLSISELQIDSTNLQAQVILEVRLGFSDEPGPFEISFKLVGQFTYTQEYSSKMVHQFLEQGSTSVMLPFARELLLNLCTRLQIPPIMLALIQLSSPPSTMETQTETSSQ